MNYFYVRNLKTSVIFFSIIFILCFAIMFNDPMNSDSFSDKGFVGWLAWTTPSFMMCYIPYIIVKLLAFVFSKFKWRYGFVYELIPFFGLIYLSYIMIFQDF